MAIALHHGDILDLKVDALVNAANTELQHKGSLAAAICEAGGSSIQAESDEIGWCRLGAAVITRAGSLGVKRVIHVPTVDYRSRRRASLEDIESGTRAALELVASNGLRSVAFPLLGTGVAGHAVKPVAMIMLAVFREFPGLDITLCVHWQNDIGAVADVLSAWPDANLDANRDG